MPWYADLELERHGARYIEPELNVALLTSDGGVLEWWTDIERTVASFEQFSAKDADDAAPLASRIRADRARTSWPGRPSRRRCRPTSGAACSSAAPPAGACSR